MKTYFFLFFYLFIVSCKDTPPVSTPTTGNITGMIVDTAGNPIAKALIQSSPPSSQVFSATDGSYRLPDVFPGIFIITAQRSGIGSGTATVNVAAGKTIEANIILIPVPPTTGTLTGQVIDSGGKAVAGATV